MDPIWVNQQNPWYEQSKLRRLQLKRYQELPCLLQHLCLRFSIRLSVSVFLSVSLSLSPFTLSQFESMCKLEENITSFYIACAGYILMATFVTLTYKNRRNPLTYPKSFFAQSSCNEHCDSFIVCVWWLLWSSSRLFVSSFQKCFYCLKTVKIPLVFKPVLVSMGAAEDEDSFRLRLKPLFYNGAK